jgi:polyisoprenoid-binding protein YceI
VNVKCEEQEVPLKSLRFALILAFFGTSPLFAVQRPIDPDHSFLTIHVGKTGWLPGAGHEHIVTALIAEGSIDDGRPSHIRFRVEAARLEVMPEEHQAEVQHAMQTRVLESSHFPEITFTSEQIQPAGDNAWHVSGKLQLHGQSRLIHLSVRKLDGRYLGTTVIKQSDYGIQPVSATGGAVKVKNELKIDFAIETR